MLQVPRDEQWTIKRSAIERNNFSNYGRDSGCRHYSKMQVSRTKLEETGTSSLSKKEKKTSSSVSFSQDFQNFFIPDGPMYVPSTRMNPIRRAERAYFFFFFYSNSQRRDTTGWRWRVVVFRNERIWPPARAPVFTTLRVRAIHLFTSARARARTRTKRHRTPALFVYIL